MPSAIDSSSRLITDPGAVGASLALLPEQFLSAQRQFRRLKLPRAYRERRHVVVGGMGGSHLAADILRAVYQPRLRVPLTITSDYQLPDWVNSNTLVIVSSYSGGTEEALALLSDAKRKRAKVIVITAGGVLARAARRGKVPLLLYEPRENPSRQPRLGIAYGLVALQRSLSTLGYLRWASEYSVRMVATARQAIKRYGATVPMEKNPAKQMARQLRGRIPLLIGSEWMVGNLLTWRNQIHENAKTWAEYALLPELNHHLLEGLRDHRVANRVVAVLVNDRKIHPRNRQRLRITSEILKKLGLNVRRVNLPASPTPAIDLLAFGGYVSWYLSILHDIDPAPIPTVDLLKKLLAK